MKAQIILALILVQCFFGVIRAQEGSQPRSQEVDGFMKLVLEHNYHLKTAREAANMAVLRAGTGNAPSDPEVEFGYLFGKPTAIGNKVNIVVKQQMDFPTAYVHRSKLRDIRSSRAELEYLLVRQDVLSTARSLWIEQVHLQQVALLLSERMDRARSIRDQVKLMMEAGEVGALEYSQASLMLASVESEFDEIQVGLLNNDLALQEIAGDRPVTVSDSLLPEPVLLNKDKQLAASPSLNPDSLLAAYLLGPEARIFEHDRQEKEREKKLAQSNHLPKISAGYFSEAVTTEAFRGFTVGLSVPLWENTRKVKTAQSAILLSEAEQDRYLAEQDRKLRQKLGELENLHDRVEKLEEALGSANTTELLSSSVESGEISLAEYFYTSDFYFRNQQQLLGYHRDILALEADLMKIYL